MSDDFDKLAEKILGAIRNELVRSFVTGGGSVAETTRVIAGLLRKHCNSDLNVAGPDAEIGGRTRPLCCPSHLEKGEFE